MDTVKKRQEDATSKETLEDLEEEDSSSEDFVGDDGGLSPDGTFDEEDELKKADPL